MAYNSEMNQLLACRSYKYQITWGSVVDKQNQMAKSLSVNESFPIDCNDNLIID